MDLSVRSSTNLPKNVMALPDFAFSEDLPSYLTCGHVLDYLEKYSDHFNVSSSIKVPRCNKSVDHSSSDGKLVHAKIMRCRKSIF